MSMSHVSKTCRQFGILSILKHANHFKHIFQHSMTFPKAFVAALQNSFDFIKTSAECARASKSSVYTRAPSTRFSWDYLGILIRRIISGLFRDSPGDSANTYGDLKVITGQHVFANITMCEETKHNTYWKQNSNNRHTVDG